MKMAGVLPPLNIASGREDLRKQYRWMSLSDEDNRGYGTLVGTHTYLMLQYGGRKNSYNLLRVGLTGTVSVLALECTKKHCREIAEKDRKLR